jgi:hypothetical protein
MLRGPPRQAGRPHLSIQLTNITYEPFALSVAQQSRRACAELSQTGSIHGDLIEQSVV